MVDGCFNPFGVAKNIFRPLAPDQSASQELKDDWMHFETLWGGWAVVDSLAERFLIFL